MANIPRTFQLGGRTWTVERGIRTKKWWGHTDSNICRIRLAHKQSPEMELHTFYHELGHAICFTLGWDELNDNEVKIDALGNMLAQFASTRE